MAALLVLALLVAPSLGDHLPLIIGGNDVSTPGKYPHQGSLTFLGRHSCGCSLISETWVITAGHCIMGVLQKVILGAHDIKTKADGAPHTYGIKQSIVHPKFDISGDGFPNDVALIELKEKANTNNEYIGTVDMAPSDATDADYSDCVITGWGAIKMIGGILPTMPNILQEAAVGIYDPETCLDMLVGDVGGVTNKTINAGHVCVGEKDMRGACSGDSGGPLVCQYKDKTVLVGLTSWGVSTCKPKYPSVYTRVSHFRDWIDGEMNPSP